ncbi:MAG: hypothetical protein J0I96_15240 [Rhodanobacter sp.]|nr:hypothetical protein [Rhodanobacter sp.]
MTHDPSSLARIGRVISRHRYYGMSVALLLVGLLFLVAAALLLYVVMQVRHGNLSMSDPTLIARSMAGSAAIGVSLILLGLWAHQTCWTLAEHGVACHKGGKIQTWRFDEIVETSRRYRQNLALVAVAWRGRGDGSWISVNARLSDFRRFHNALTAANTAARTPWLLDRLHRGEALDFVEWPEGVSSAMTTDFGTTMDALAAKSRPAVRLTRDSLAMGDRHVELAAIDERDVPDTWAKPVVHLRLRDGSTALTLGYQRIIDFPLLMALVETMASRARAKPVEAVPFA